MEFTQGFTTVVRNIYVNNKGSLARTLIYTIGHFMIAIAVLKSVCLLYTSDAADE